MTDPAMEIHLRPGDVYCPRCWGFSDITRSEMHFSQSSRYEWECARCGVFDWPCGADKDGRFTWIWDDEHPAPNPGCPWCRTRAISWDEDDIWFCRRVVCNRTWRGTWTRKSGQGWESDRWLIKVPVSEVPWVSGTKADLKCYRRIGDITPSYDFYTPSCCRWPKSCRAFDPGFTTGKGPTTLPIIWYDGAVWCSGLPDMTGVPEHLSDQIWARWMKAQPVSQRQVVNDDDGCGQGCEYICWHPADEA